MGKNRYWSIRHVTLFIAPGLIGYAFTFLYPTIYSLWLSLTDWTGWGEPAYIGLENFSRVLHDRIFGFALGMAARGVILQLVGTLPFAFVLAYLLSRRVRGGRVFRFIYFLPLVIPGSVLATMFKELFAHDGALNFTLTSLGLEGLILRWLVDDGIVQWTVLAPDFWASVSFFIILFAAGLEGVSQELYDAAAIDGAGGFRQLIHVTVPAMRGVYTSAMVLALPGALGAFIYPFIMTNGGPLHRTTTLPLWVFKNVGGYGGDNLRYGYGSAIAMVQLVIGSVVGVLVYWYGRRKVELG
jgi:ABC-type sugar transport system permease subunit